MPDTLKRQIVLRPEFTLNIYGGSGSGGSQTPVALPARNTVDPTVTELLVAVKELTAKVNDQQNDITALGKLVVDQQNKITALETRIKSQPWLAQTVDCGTWKVAHPGRAWNSARQEAYIKFAKNFMMAPKVTVTLNLVDADHGYNLRIAVYSTDVDIYEVGITWIAVGL
ncbi:hypothetical protein CMQ_7791 [Grosmannia clavigera kw1407]|uniref:H-type lectin domain-containing protein n=1 Tax=Grosmannia clavigera (strain kw1407 / UAMH 11150) TaxID=655863 RepID=F0XRX4_GROCL|nr:uncharacterized protein CMQ_7791 [Grosmannia clavigera kw1407]EFW99423.1 hypothetical protein CMQ_7791 [Grosmannia clavigera kw1407]